ncbi:MAG: acetylornithine transaminase [Actinomycetota bacterium]|nr:acetylornithine transaminase [Actinomycetota bacterium]
MSTFEDIRTAEAAYHMHVYGRQPVAFVRGEGMHLYDTNGRAYLDFVGGIAVISTGHSHPDVVRAIQEQAATLSHVSNLYYTEPQVKLAQRLHDLLGWGKVFFANSGAEANECAVKLARKHTLKDGAKSKFKVVAAMGSFHGRTVATLAATGQPHKHEPFAPLPAEFSHVPLNDEHALDSAVGDETSAVLLEVIQGEGGVNLATPEFLNAARKFCDERGAVLIFDEVQTGLGRTGRWFAFEHAGVIPDVITLAKSLGGGLPIGACVAQDEIASAFGRGDHATTFGGGPVPSAAALATIDVIDREGLVENSARMGERLVASLRAKTAGNPAVKEVRGTGLLVAVQLNGEWAADIVAAALLRGLLVNNVTPSAVRLSPPLVATAGDIDRAAGVIGEIVDGYRTA